MRSIWRLSSVTAAILALAAPALGKLTLYEGDLGEVVTSGFLRVQTDIHTGEQNPNNRPLGRGNNRLQLFRQWALVDAQWQTPWRSVKFFTRTRIWSDTTEEADDNLTSYDAFPTHYHGDGWFLRASNDTKAIELWEAWADYNERNWWFRVGRQTIVWGDVAPTRLLDDINPLDLSWHLVLEPLGKEVFDQLRIPIWAARGSYSLPFAPDYQLEGYISPDEFAFVSTQLPATGSPLSVIGLPPFIKLRDDVKNGQKGVSGGVRFLGTFRGFNFTIDWLNRHNGDGVTVFESFTPDPTSPIGGIIRLRQRHPRFNTVGASLNYFEPTAKAVARLEFAWDIARPWESPDTMNSRVIRRHQYGYAIAIDRPSFIIRRDRTALITLQFEQRFRERADDTPRIGIAGAPVDPHSEVITLLFDQPFRGFGGRYDEFFLDFALLASTSDAYAFVPLFRYEPGNHWRLNLWYNHFSGPFSAPITGPTPGGFGSMTWANGANMSVSYQF